jgi:hypothetical protein
LLAGICAALVLASAATIALAPALFRDRRVTVTFITEPHPGATVILDGVPLLGPDDRPSATLPTTPCTIDGIPAGIHSVAFRLEGHPDLDAGTIDFRSTRQVIARWPEER